MHRLLRTLPQFLTLAVLLTACRDDPRRVLDDARAALAARDDAAFLRLVEPWSAQLLRDGEQVVSKSGHAWKVLREGRPSPTLLPKGDVVGEPVESGHTAVVMVNQGLVQRRVPFKLIQGQWRLDLLESDAFWSLTKPAE